MNTEVEWSAAVEWLGAMTVCALLLWAANQRARIHASLRHERLIHFVDAARQLITGPLAAFATIGGA